MAKSLSFVKTPLSLFAVSILTFESVAPSLLYAESPLPVLGSIEVRNGRWSEVPRLLDKLVPGAELAPVQFQLVAATGEQYFIQNHYEEARKSFQRLLKAKKPSPSQFTLNNATLRIAESHLLQGRSPEAIETVQALTKDSNPYIAEEAIFLQARSYLYQRNWSEMNRAVAEILRRNPAYSNDLALNLLRSVAWIEQDQIDQAIPYLKKYPDEPSALYYLGVAYISKKELSNALPIYQAILQKTADSEWVDWMRLALGEAFYNAKDYTLAQEFFKPVTRPSADPALRALALHRRVCLFFNQKKFDDCTQILTFLLKEYPTHPLRSQWTYLYASIPILQKDWKQAIREQKAAMELERGLAAKVYGLDTHQLRISAEFRILWAHLLLNDFNDARQLADQFIQRYPKEQMASYAYLAKGVAYYRMGDFDTALDVYQKLLNEYPTSSACGKAVYLMTLCLHSARDPFRMAGILNQVHERMQKAPDLKSVDEWTQNTLYWVADAYYQLNDLTSAEKIYKEFVARAPQSQLVPYALEALGATLSAQGPQRDGEAVIALQQAQLRARDLGDITLAEQVELELGKLYFNQREFAKAATTWEHIVQVSKDQDLRAEALFRQGEALTRQQYYEEAIGRWRNLIKFFPKSAKVPEALLRIGQTQGGLGKWPEASATFTRLKSEYATTEQGKEGAFQLVQTIFNQNNMNAAATELLSFAQAYPDDPRIPKAADNLLSAFDQRKVTIPASQQAALLKLAPGSAGGAALLWKRGAGLFNEGKYEPAQKIFEKIMLSYPNDEFAPMAYFYNADCFFWLKRWEDAASAYQNFYLSFPKHERVPNAMFQKAVCLYNKGSYDDAVSDFSAFIKKYPDHALAKEAWLNIALAHKKAFQLDQAVAAYKYVVNTYPADPKVNAVWLQLGSLLEVQGKQADAARIYGKVPSNAIEYPEALYRRAMQFEGTKKPADARHELETLRALPDKQNEFRVAALIKLVEYYEQEGQPAAKLRPLYEDLKNSTKDAEVAKQAALRLKEL